MPIRSFAALGRQRRHAGHDALWRRLKPTVLALIVPLLLLAFWQVATTQQWTRLIPTPAQVGEYMVDFAVGRHLRRCLLGDAA